MAEVSPGVAGLFDWWECDEAGSVSRIGAHASNALTVTGTVNDGAGKIGRAADVPNINYNYLSGQTSWAPGTSDFSVVLWYKGVSSTARCFWDCGRWNPGFEGRVRGLDGYGGFKFHTSSGTYELDLSGAGWSTDDNVWHMVACTVRRSGDMVAYLDGSQIGTTVDVSAASGENISAWQYVRFPAENALHAGLYDLISWWTGVALSADHIAWLWNSGAGRTYADLAGGAAGLPVIAWEHARIFGG